MKTAWIIAAREVREKARLFVVCAGLALVPFAATLLPGTSGSANDTIAVVGGFLAAILGLGISVTLGASTVARDLAERRMSFYFTKPVSATALWLGKSLGSLLVGVACFAIIAVPALLASGRQWAAHWLGDTEPIAGGAFAIAVLFFLAHAVSTILRSRSPLLALDFVFLIVAVAAVYLIVRPLFLGTAMLLASRVAGLIALGAIVIVAVAPVWQLANGRSDIRRSHAALMRFLWPGIAIVLLVAGGVVAWLVHVSPADVEVTRIDQPARGTMAIVSGRAKHRLDYQPTFLVDRATGRFTRIAAPAWWGTQFSVDGRVAAWLQPVGTFWRSGLELHTANGPTSIMMPMSGAFLLSPDGRRVAIANGNLLAVHDLATGELLAAAAGLDARARHQLLFVTPDLVRVYEKQDRLRTPTLLRVFELDVRARETRRTGERLFETPRHPVSVSGDGSRMFVQGANVIADGRTAEPIVTLDVPNVTDAAMLYDGSVALIAYADGVPHLRTFGPDGTPRYGVAFDGVRSIWIAAETEDGKLILAAYGKTVYVVDLTTGAIERKLDGVRGPSPGWSDEPRLTRYARDQEFVGVDASGKLILWSTSRPAPRPLL